MTRALAIAGRELRSLFLSPIAYVVTASYLALLGIFWWFTTTGPYAAPDARQAFERFAGNMHVFLLFVIPAMSMRAIAEERRSRTLELLVTQPVRDVEIVVGKWLACVGLLAVMLLATLHFYVQMHFWTEGDLADKPVWSIYLGLLLAGSLYLAVGVFFSSITENQVVAAILTFVAIIAAFFGKFVGENMASVDVGWLQQGVRAVVLYGSTWEHFDDFARGVLDTKHIVYYVLAIAGFLFMAVRSLERRSWGQ